MRTYAYASLVEDISTDARCHLQTEVAGPLLLRASLVCACHVA